MKDFIKRITNLGFFSSILQNSRDYQINYGFAEDREHLVKDNAMVVACLNQKLRCYGKEYQS